jgi:hypothetical protein
MKNIQRLFTVPWALAMLILGLAVSCTTNELGRHQLMLVSGSEMTQLGISSFDQMKKEVPISKDPAANDMVRRGGERIKSVANLPDAQWEFVVFESKEVNAFCLPGGKIGVTPELSPCRMTRDWLRCWPRSGARDASTWRGADERRPCHASHWAGSRRGRQCEGPTLDRGSGSVRNWFAGR